MPVEEGARTELHSIVHQENVVPLIYVHGSGLSGKSIVVRDAVDGHPSISINACFYDSSQQIIKQISNFLIGESVCCMRELVEALLCKGFERPHFVVIDNADALLRIDRKCIFLLARLRQVSRNSKISVILISRKQWSEFGSVTSGLYPRIIHCTPQTQLVNIIKAPAEINLRIFDQIIKYVDDVSKKNHDTLPFKLAVLRGFYPLAIELPESYFNNKNPFAKLKPEVKSLIDAATVNSALDGLLASLSSVEKYMLMACYLASLILPKNDSKIFGSNYGRKRKVKQMPQKSGKDKTAKEPRQKMIPFERLMAIFYMIYKPELVAPTRNIVLSSLANLVEQRLILRMTPYSKVESYRYKVNISQQFMNTLSNNCGFQYHKYLID